MMSESFESERKNSLDDPSGAETVDTNHDSEGHESGSEVEEIIMDGRERVFKILYDKVIYEILRKAIERVSQMKKSRTK